MSLRDPTFTEPDIERFPLNRTFLIVPTGEGTPIVPERRSYRNRVCSEEPGRNVQSGSLGGRGSREGWRVVRGTLTTFDSN